MWLKCKIVKFEKRESEPKMHRTARCVVGGESWNYLDNYCIQSAVVIRNDCGSNINVRWYRRRCGTTGTSSDYCRLQRRGDDWVSVARGDNGNESNDS